MPQSVEDFAEQLADRILAWADEEELLAAWLTDDQRGYLVWLIEHSLLSSGRA